MYINAFLNMDSLARYSLCSFSVADITISFLVAFFVPILRTA